jgi:tetratricopeptide (TPR) repeat protein/4-amino-4-deoxy-L-arabinose transferase-like glycosyltransferase
MRQEQAGPRGTRPARAGRNSESGESGYPPRPGRGSAQGARPGRCRAELLSFVFLVVLAAALRIGYTFASRSSPYFDHLDLDTKFYDSWARRIAAGDWLGKEVFFMGPLYPYFLGIIYKIFGPSLLAAKLVQALVGSVTAGIVYLLGKECFGVAVGLVAGIMAAVYVPFIFTDSLILFPVLATLLNTLALYFLYRGLRRDSGQAFFGSGVFTGLSAAGNASILAFVPAAVAFILVYAKPAAGRLVRAGLYAAGIALVVAPILVRNYAVGKDFVPLTSNAGLNFFIGNSAKATGAYVKPDGLDIYTDPEGKAIAERAAGHPLKPSQVSAYWAGRAREYIRAHPSGFAYNMVRKVFFFWSVYEIPQIEHLPFERRYSWILRIPTPSFGIVCPLGLVGAALALKRRKEAWLLVFFIIAYSASIIAFFVVARYRLPVVPALMVFAAYFIVWFASTWKRRHWRSVVYSLAAFLALFILVHVNFYRIHPLNGFAQSYYRLGIIYEGKGDLPKALADYRKALEIDPTIVPARVNLGILLSRQGEYSEAERELKDATVRDPDYDKAFYNLALVYAERGVNDSAVVLLDRALAINPGYSLAKLAKAGAYYEMGQLGDAQTLLASLERDRSLLEPSKKQIGFLLGLIPDRRAWIGSRPRDYQKTSDRYLLRGDDLASLGLTPRALDAYLRAVGADSLSTPARFQAGTMYLNSGDPDRALAQYREVLKLDPSYRGAHFAAGVVAYRRGDVRLACREFEDELTVDPASANAHINLAMCYEQQLGDLSLAASHLRRYIELTGGTAELKKHLGELEAKLGGAAK